LTQIISTILPWVIGIAGIVVTLATAGHVILNKRDVRAAIGWTGLVVLSPFLGATAYYFLGINRIRRRAARLASGRAEHAADAESGSPLPQELERLGSSLRRLSRVVEKATETTLSRGNAVTPLVNGDRGYPEMLRAIETAKRSVAMATYIFDDDYAGGLFVDALAEAEQRGVEVRVLVDGVGARYSRPPITRRLARRGVTCAQFLRSRIPLRNPYMNLRNHRKILVVDGRVAFVGGLNIREGCLIERPSRHPTQDVHFRVEGPVVQQIFPIFAEDWHFTTRERLCGPAWDDATTSAGPLVARAIADGPDEDFETVRWTLLAALGAAQRSVRIVTPYFLPEAPLISALQLAAMRGIEVDIVLPEVNNLRFVQWASTAQLWQVLQHGCRVWLSRPPFDHSKIMVVDGAWTLVGSANWDARSLRLNFEIALECYDETLAGKLIQLSDEKIRHARPVTLEEVDSRSVPVRLRDGVARLLSPYL